MKRLWLSPFVLAALLLLGWILVQQLVSVGGSDLLSRTLNNALHIPWFAMVTVLLWLLMGRPSIARLLLLSAAVGGLTELAQIPTARDASFGDLGLDLLGAGLVAAGLSGQRWSGRARSLTWAAVLLALVVLTAAAPVAVVLAYEHRDRLWPQVLEPGSWRQRLLLNCNGPMAVVPAPQDWPRHAGGRVLSLRWADRTYPGLTFEEVVPDWQGYETLVVDVYVTGDAPAQLTAAVGHVGSPGTAAFLPRDLAPGPQQLRFPVDQLALDRSGRPASISHLILHTSREYAGREVLLGAVYLE